METLNLLASDDKYFFKILLGFNAYLKSKFNCTQVTENNVKIIRFDNDQVKCDCIEGSIVTSIRKPSLFNSV